MLGIRNMQIKWRNAAGMIFRLCTRDFLPDNN